MKSLKMSVAASIATIAVIFSIMPSIEIISHAKWLPDEYCYTSSIQSNLTCTSSAISITSTTLCTEATSFVNRPLLNVSTFQRFLKIDIELNCPGGNIFCCAEIQSMPTAICANPPQPRITIDGIFSYYKISAIHCTIQ